MRLPKIDKEIIEHFFPGKKLKCIAQSEECNIRSYSSKDKSYAITIGRGENCIKPLVELYTRFMVVRRDGFCVVITHYDDSVVVLLSDCSFFKLKVVHPVRLPKFNDEGEMYDGEEYEDNELEDDEYDDDCDYDEMPYAYTNGRWCPCPYCGSDRITTYMDGTAQCDDCKREFTYMKF